MLSFIHKLLGIADEPPAPAPVREPEVPVAAPVVSEAGMDVPRLEIVQKMWGEGFSAPVNLEAFANMTVPLALDPQKTILDLAAGLGGSARFLAKQYKTYVTGFERDSELAEAGMNLSNLTGHARHATIAHYDPEHFEYGKKADAILVRELIYTLRDKDSFIEKLAEHLKPRGHLLITDFNCDPDYFNRPPVSLWIAAEPYGAFLVPVKTMVALLEKHGFDVRVSEDISKVYTRGVLQGLARLTSFLEGKRLSKTTKGIVGREVDVWAKRLAALDAAVQNTRYYAIKKR